MKLPPIPRAPLDVIWDRATARFWFLVILLSDDLPEGPKR